MKISRLRISNFLGIEEMDLAPGKVNLIRGKNAFGKTSILEAIEKAFTNKSRRPRVLRDGAEKSIILIDLDNSMSVRRTITSTNDTLKVSKEGFEAKAPQTVLTGMIGQFGFNPTDFLTKSEKEQADILLKVAPIQVTKTEVASWIGGEAPNNVDYSQHGLQVCKDLKDVFYERRRTTNAEVKALKGQVDTLDAKIPGDFDPEPYRNVSLRDKYNQLSQAQKQNNDRKSAENTLESIKQKQELLKQTELSETEKVKREAQAKRDEIERQIALLQQKLTQVTELEQKDLEEVRLKNKRMAEDLAKKEDEVKAFLATTPVIDIEPLEREVQEFEEKKNLVSLFDNREEVRNQLIQTEDHAKKFDEIVKLLDAKPQELVANAKLPIQGLGIDDDGMVTIDGRPVKNLSTSEQIRVTLEIARATAGDLKLICIDRIESLDPETQEELYRQIADDDFQYFITEVASGDVTINQVV